MKRISTTLLAVILVITATLTASAQAEQTRKVSGFKAIGVSGAFNVHVKINGTESLKISGPADIINDVETNVEGGNLEIKYKKEKERNNSHQKVDIYITAKTLSGLTSAGANSISCDGELTGDKVELMMSGAGSTTISVNSASVHATMSGAGILNIKGSAKNANMSATGACKINAKDFKTEVFAVTLTGASDAHIYASKELSARITGAGRLIYGGNAVPKIVNTVMAGQVTKEKGE